MQLTDLSPDLILLDGRIYTMDARRTVVDAVAIKDGRFIAAGASSEILRFTLRKPRFFLEQGKFR